METVADKLFKVKTDVAVAAPIVIHEPAKLIYKFALRIEDECKIEMPRGAALLHVGTQGCRPQVWALVDPAAPYCRRLLRVLGTGKPLPDALGKYVGTVVMPVSLLVWHVFDAGELSS